MLLYILSFFTLFTTNSPFQDMNSEMELLKATKSIYNNNIKEMYIHLNNAVLYEPKNQKNKLPLAIYYSILKQYRSSLNLIKNIDNDTANFYIYYDLYMGSTKENFNKYYKKILVKLIKSNLSEEKYMFLATTLYDLDKKKSILFFKKAIKLNKNILSLQYIINPKKDIVNEIYKNLSPPHNYVYYNAYANLLLKFKDTKNAKIYLDKALKDKNNDMTLKLYSDLYIIEKKYKKAMKYLTKIKDNLGSNIDLYSNYISVYQNTNLDKKDLLEICKKAAFLTNSIKVKYCVAKTYYDLKEYNKAYSELEYLIRKEPENPDINLLIFKTIDAIFQKIDSDVYNKKIPVNYAMKLKNEYPTKRETYLEKVLKSRPYDFDIIKILYLQLYRIDISEDKLSEFSEKNKSPLLSIVKEYQNFLTRKKEIRMFNTFYDLFENYLKNGDKDNLKELKSLNKAPIIMDYINYLEKKDDSTLNVFLKRYSKRYVDLLFKPYKGNQKYYKININNKSLEYLKVLDFIIPTYY